MKKLNTRILCVGCRKAIITKPRTMRLQITNEEKRFTDRSRKLGFTSETWRRGDFMEGQFHKECFNLASLVWQIAFETRALSPRHE